LIGAHPRLCPLCLPRRRPDPYTPLLAPRTREPYQKINHTC
jgi:hypothetical protein